MPLTERGRYVFTSLTEQGRSFVNSLQDNGIYIFGTLMSKPVINIITFSTSIISSVPGKDQCTVTFQSDQDLISWIAKADGSGHTTGLTVGSGTTASANTDIQFVIDDEEFTSGDKNYIITVYGENSAGWSDE